MKNNKQNINSIDEILLKYLTQWKHEGKPKWKTRRTTRMASRYKVKHFFGKLKKVLNV